MLSQNHDSPCLALIAAMLLLTHVTLLAWVAYVNSPTVDEVAHLPSGISHWHLGNFDLYRVNPPLVRMIAALPVLACDFQADWRPFGDAPYYRAEFPIGQHFVKNNGMRAYWYFTLARWACIPISLLGGWVCFRWASDLYGAPSGLLALSLWVFSPNIIAHGAQITPDLAAASLGCLASFVFWRWLTKPNWRLALVAGVLLGVAELSKTSWIVLYVLWPALWAVWRCLQNINHNECIREVKQLVVILVLAVYVVNLGYQFENSLKPLQDFEFVSKTLSGKDRRIRKPGNRFAGTLLGRLPVPFPENYIRGIDVQKLDFERRKWSYLRGEQKLGGWWWYYIYACAIKVPMGTWLIGFLAVAVTSRHPGKYVRFRDECILLGPAIVIFVLVSSQTGFNRYLRYVVPAFPFVFIFVSKVARSIELRQRRIAALAVLALAASIVSSLFTYPHSLSYFNMVVRGPRAGHAHLLDGNIDWGQDLLRLRWWIDAHPEVSEIGVAYFGLADIETAGIEAESVPWGPVGEKCGEALAEHGPQPGWYAVSINHIRGYRRYRNYRPYYKYFREFRPVAMAGYSIYIYHIPLEDANRVRREMGMSQLPEDYGT